MVYKNMYWVIATETYEKAKKIYQFLKNYFGFKNIIIRHTNLYNIYLPDIKETEENIIQQTYRFSEDFNENICIGGTVISKDYFNEKLLKYTKGL